MDSAKRFGLVNNMSCTWMSRIREKQYGMISFRSGMCIERTAINTLAYLCDGDARTGLNGLQMAVQARLTKLPHQNNTHGFSNGIVIKEDHVKEGLQRSHILYDRAG